MYFVEYFDPKFYEESKIGFNYKFIARLSYMYAKIKKMENIVMYEE